MKRTLIIFALLTILSSAYGADIYVAPGQSIQAAIDAAAPGSNIIVLPGSYKENINFKGKAIKVTSLDPNDPTKVNTTIIDGNNPADANFASTVTFNSGEGNSSILTGFTITGGSGTWALISWESQGLKWNRCGGGIACYNQSQPTIIKNVIKDNFAGMGGGIFVYGNPINPNMASNPAIHIKPVIRDNIFINNSAIVNHGFIPPDAAYLPFDRGDGGAISCFQGSDAVIRNNSISQNYAKNYGGGVFLQQWSNALIQNNQVTDNNSLFGGGIQATYFCAPDIRENIISLNTARGLGGAGISLYYYSSGTITYNSIIHNKAIGSKGGGIGMSWSSTANIENNLIAKNYSVLGGGVYVTSGSADLKNNTIAANNSDEGSGIYIGSTAVLTAANNITSLNRGAAQIYKDPQASINPSYNNVWTDSGENFSGDINNFIGINGNISEDPNFTSADNNDFTLTVFSPCINGGDPNFVPLAGQKDLNGDDRVIGQYVDIGADEAWPVLNITKNKKYKKIQDAVNDSNNIETVIVGCGRYYEKIAFGAHQLILSSSDANDWSVVEKTIIDANKTGPVVTIANKQDANSILRGFTLTNGTNSSGGGIICKASPVIEKNIIMKCSGGTGGGLYFANSGTKPIVRSNIIISNTADFGAGLVCDTASEVTLTGNYFSENIAHYTGGAISCSSTSKATCITGNEFIFNRALIGAAVMLEQMNVKSLIDGNFFAGNITGLGGGAISCYQADPNIVNNTFISNRSLGYNANTGIINIEVDSNPLIANNIIAHCDYGIGIYTFSGQGYPPSNPVIYNNDVYDCNNGNYGGGLTDKTGVNGNICAKPKIVHKGYWIDPNTPTDPSDDYYIAGNYHIRPDSPCVNAGNNSFVPALLTLDIDSEQRIYEAIVDMGADEVVKNPFDLNTDGIVDGNELSILASHWLETETGLPVDFYEDGSIDFLDLAMLGQQWYWMGGWFNGYNFIPEPPCQDPNGTCFDSYTSCQAHWKLDETSGTIALEEINSKNGTLINFPTDNSQWTSGKINNALKFDGANDYVSTDFSYLKTADNFTITFWLKADDITFCRHIVWQGDPVANGWGGQQEMHISLGNQTEELVTENNKLSFYMSSNLITAGKSLHIAADFSDTTSWHFVAVKIQDLSNSPYAEMYIDGNSVGTDTMNAADINRTNWVTGLRFGKPGTSERFFRGMLDNILIYNRCLTVDEIQELYNAPNQ